MDTPVNLNDEACRMTIEVNDKSRNDLLSAKMDSQFIPTQFLPEYFFGGRHFAAEFSCSFELFFCDKLSGDDVFDGHDGNTNPSQPSPRGMCLKSLTHSEISPTDLRVKPTNFEIKPRNPKVKPTNPPI